MNSLSLNLICLRRSKSIAETAAETFNELTSPCIGMLPKKSQCPIIFYEYLSPHCQQQ